MRMLRSLITALIVLGVSSPAFADITAFIGTTSAPTNRPAKGFAFGIALLVVGFEFEYSATSEELLDAAPRLRTGMGNVYVQTPFPVFGMQPYLTTGGGAYREQLGALQETNFGLNNGGGVKISLLGPIRARVDYRVFKLRGAPLHDVVHRVYGGINLSF